MKCLFRVIGLCFAACASAQDLQLAALHGTLVALHSLAAKPGLTPMRTGPDLTLAKHQLRDWIESRLDAQKGRYVDSSLMDKLNRELQGIEVTDLKDDQDRLGTLSIQQMSWDPGLFVVITAVGIPCQDDHSAYGYKYSDGRWIRVWESEQIDYQKGEYAPQLISAVHVWQSYKDGREEGPTYVMSLGYGWGCMSTWHDVHYRIWRVDTSGSKLLIDGKDFGWMRSELFLIGSIRGNMAYGDTSIHALIEFTERSIDTGVHNREAVFHYQIQGDEVRRVDPVALSPRDFVDEWLTRPWAESAAWSASPALQSRYHKIHSGFAAGDFLEATKHCHTVDLWQVAVQLSDSKTFELGPKTYFLVRWRPPYHFSMVSILDKPSPRCTQQDPEADEWRTLFSVQEWVR
jgi:hypothetical protein